MSKDDQPTIDNPIDQLEEKYLQSANLGAESSDASSTDDDSAANSTPNLEDIRSAGL